MHVVNTVHPLCPTSCEGGGFELVLPYIHGATSVDLGVFAHLRGGEGLAQNVVDPITELVVARRYEASLLVVEGELVGFDCSDFQNLLGGVL